MRLANRCGWCGIWCSFRDFVWSWFGAPVSHGICVPCKNRFLAGEKPPYPRQGRWAR